jgi:hypothetical protein
MLNAKHPATLTSRANLAMPYESQGRLNEAEILAKQVLEARIRVFGTGNPAVLISQAHLAMT